jgi:hypothetical protein
MKTFTGFFNHMFNLNDFCNLDAFQETLENEGISFKHIAIHDVIAFELLRLQLGFQDYTGLEKVYYFIGGNPLHAILRDKLFFPAAADVSHVMTRIPSKMLKEFYHDLAVSAHAALLHALASYLKGNDRRVPGTLARARDNLLRA